jgi:hypothetical protein
VVRQESALWLLGACVATLPLLAVNPEALGGDPAIYRDRMAELFAGQIPYVDAAFEHLPVAAVPMALAWVLGGAASPWTYTIVFATLMLGCLLATALLLDTVGRRSGLGPAGKRWVVLSLPVLPLVLFRYEPWVVLLVAAALAAGVTGRHRATALLQWLAIGVKGWPVVLAAGDWLKGHRARAFLAALVTAACAGLLLALPGFRAARAFRGIHTDTLAGGVLTLTRWMAGEPVGRFDAAGAIYVDAPGWTLLVGLNVGVAVAALALLRVNTPLTREAGYALSGALVAALLLASPLFSPQFILWLTPFVALHRQPRVHVLGFVSVALTGVFMLGWHPLYEGNLWWLPLVSLRNAALLGLALTVAWSVGSQRPREERPGGVAREPSERSAPAAVVG